MSSLSDLLLREAVDVNYQTKGSTLTFEELDSNLILLANVIRENIVNINPGGIDAYNGATEYSSGMQVTHAGNFWEYTNPAPSTGNTPAIGSAFWTLQSTGALAHAQNTDTHTTQNTLGIGDGADTDKDIYARNGDANTPRLRYSASGNKWQYSNDGTTFLDFAGGAWGSIAGNVEDQNDLVAYVATTTDTIKNKVYIGSFGFGF